MTESRVQRFSSSFAKKAISRQSWPKFVKAGSVTIKVYRTRRRGSFLYCVSHHIAGRRLRRNFADEKRAMLEARRVATKFSNGENKLIILRPEEWRLYELAQSALHPFQIPIDSACREYAQAREVLGEASVLTAARFFVERGAERLTTKNVADLVEDFIQAKVNAGVGKRAIADYRSRLRRFSDAFHCSVSSITKDQLQEFLDSLKIGLRTKRNFKANLVTFFDYARSRNCLPRDRKTEAEHLDSVEVPPTGIDILPPKNLAKLLRAADDSLIPYLTIRAFAGIRDSEINRMEWQHIKLEERQIEVPASVAKPIRGRRVLRRLVPIQPNLEQWLAPYSQSEGTICVYYNSERAARKLAHGIKIKWVHNGLRHGYGSCRVAQTKNYPLVAYEMGNSVDVIKACYDQVVTEKEANAWFSICPKTARNIIQLSSRV